MQTALRLPAGVPVREMASSRQCPLSILHARGPLLCCEQANLPCSPGGLHADVSSTYALVCLQGLSSTALATWDECNTSKWHIPCFLPVCHLSSFLFAASRGLKQASPSPSPPAPPSPGNLDAPLLRAYLAAQGIAPSPSPSPSPPPASLQDALLQAVLTAEMQGRQPQQVTKR